MPRFVILLHETSKTDERLTHFDLMLEQNDGLRTWAMEKLPTVHEAVFADQLPAHRLAYLDYEGQISGDRGVVSRVDAGEYEKLQETQTRLLARICGRKLQGTLTLSLDDGVPHRWRVALSDG